MKTIQITVDPQGRSRVETRGFRGPSCRQASLPYEEALGTTSAERVTAAFHERPESGLKIEQPN